MSSPLDAAPRTPERCRRRQSRLVVGLVAATSIHGLVASSLAVAIPGIGHRFSVGPGVLPLVVLAGFLGAAVGAPAAGWLVDRVGPARLLIVALAAAAVASAAAAAAPVFAVLVVARAGLGIATSALYPAAISLLARENRSLGRPLWTGGSAIVFGSEVAFGVGPAVGGSAAALGGWRLTCLVGVPVVVAALGLLVGGLGQTAAASAAPGDSGGIKGSPYATFDDSDTARRADGRAVRAALVRVLAQYVGTYSVVFAAPVWLLGRGMGTAVAGATVIPLAVVSAVAVMAASHPRVTRRAALLASSAALATAGVGFAVATATESSVVVLGVCAAVGVASAASVANQRSLLAAVPSRWTASAAGWSRSVQFIGGQAAALLAGWLGPAAGGSGLWAMASVLVGVAVVMAVATIPASRGGIPA